MKQFALPISIIVLVIASAALYIYSDYTPTPPKNEPVFCTQDAMQCSDGSYVSRVGPNCEFAQCPLPKATSTPQTSPASTSVEVKQAKVS